MTKRKSISQYVRSPTLLGLIAILIVTGAWGCERPPADTNTKAATESDQKALNQNANLSADGLDSLTTGEKLFDGETLTGWEQSNYGSNAEIKVTNGCIHIETGFPINGFNSTRDDLPLTNYAITLEGKKIDGDDFFCGLTFPVGDSHCSLILGGWGGVVCGLSCIDREDANNNDTKTLKKFEQDQWYKIKVQVTDEKIVATLDDEVIAEQMLEGKKIELRSEVLPSRPLGITSFQTESAFRNIVLHRLGGSSKQR